MNWDFWGNGLFIVITLLIGFGMGRSSTHPYEPAKKPDEPPK